MLVPDWERDDARSAWIRDIDFMSFGPLLLPVSVRETSFRDSMLDRVAYEDMASEGRIRLYCGERRLMKILPSEHIELYAGTLLKEFRTIFGKFDETRQH